MNYRHAYHAGNFADVLKHAVLVWAVGYLQQKEGGLCLLDSHGGAGLYDLTDARAQKTGEARGGILTLADAADRPAVFEPYLQLVARAGEATGAAVYPGSAWLIAALLRTHDRAVIGELHPEDALALRANLGAFDRVRIIDGDGYALLNRSVPPPEKRGLVLIDPPFEETDEFERLARTVIAAHGKWPTGVYLIWYPVKDRAGVARFHAEIANAQIGRMTELAFDVGGSEEGLRACGLLLINAPWTLETEWRAPLEWLVRTLARDTNASASMRVIS